MTLFAYHMPDLIIGFFAGAAATCLTVGALDWFLSWLERRRSKPSGCDQTPYETLSDDTMRDVALASCDGHLAEDAIEARCRLISSASKSGIDCHRFRGPGKWAGLAEATRKEKARRGR